VWGSAPSSHLELSDTQEVTPACWPALQAMSSLTVLVLVATGIKSGDVTPEVRAAFDCERVRRGWPCLRLEVLDYWKRGGQTVGEIAVRSGPPEWETWVLP
jgi:hypothetical protein